MVDDEVEIRDLVADYLGRYGFDVRACASGAELDGLLAEAPADLVILDVSTPGEDGLSIVRRLRATSAVSIIMLTGRNDAPAKLERVTPAPCNSISACNQIIAYCAANNGAWVEGAHNGQGQPSKGACYLP